MATAVEPTGNRDIDGILWGWKWSSRELTYSFPTDISGYGYTINGFEAFNAGQQELAERALDDISSFTGLTFRETTGDTSLRFAEADSYNDGSGVVAIATGRGIPPDPNIFPTHTHGDMWFNHEDYNRPTLSNAAHFGFMHEIGHALGLKHGHQTSAVYHGDHTDDLPALPANHDSFEYSVMTYSQYVGDVVPSDNAVEHPTTYMQNDIAALQYMYGANFTFRADNTTYSWNPDTGEMSIDGDGQGRPGTNYILMTVWDGGGTDTYNFSNYETDLVIDLRPGNWTITSDEQRADLGDGHFARGNIANARLYQDDTGIEDTRSLIENAIGGVGNDVIFGNQAANTLEGRDGIDWLSGEAGNDVLNGGEGADILAGGDHNDRLKGGGGADTLDGGNGNDTASYSDSVVGVIANLASGTGLLGSAQGDTLAFIENLAGSMHGDILIGDSKANTLSGGGGNDTLMGGGGADTLDGGTHTGIGDTASYVDSNARVSVNLATGFVLGGFAQGDRLVSIENLLGSRYDDILTGDSNDNRLSGDGGRDTLQGGGGADRLDGGAGNDTLTGGSHNDTFVFRNGFGSDRITDFASGLAAGDVIEISLGANYDNIGEIHAAARQGGLDLILDFGNNGQITIANTTWEHVVNDFLFV